MDTDGGACFEKPNPCDGLGALATCCEAGVLKPSGAVCRDSNAAAQCTGRGYCDGKHGFCPVSSKLKDGTPCRFMEDQGHNHGECRGGVCANLHAGFCASYTSAINRHYQGACSVAGSECVRTCVSDEFCLVATSQYEPVITDCRTALPGFWNAYTNPVAYASPLTEQPTGYSIVTFYQPDAVDTTCPIAPPGSPCVTNGLDGLCTVTGECHACVNGSCSVEYSVESTGAQSSTPATSSPPNSLSELPNGSPSGSPSESLVGRLTDRPTQLPSVAPSAALSFGPSDKPSGEPSLSPISATPSNAPFRGPSMSPSVLLSTASSRSSDSPSPVPSSSPLRHPSTSPNETADMPTHETSSAPVNTEVTISHHSTSQILPTMVPANTISPSSSNPSISSPPSLQPLLCKEWCRSNQAPIATRCRYTNCNGCCECTEYDTRISACVTSDPSAHPSTSPSGKQSSQPTVEPSGAPSISLSELPSASSSTTVHTKLTQLPTTNSRDGGSGESPSGEESGEELDFESGSGSMDGFDNNTENTSTTSTTTNTSTTSTTTVEVIDTIDIDIAVWYESEYGQYVIVGCAVLLVCTCFACVRHRNQARKRLEHSFDTHNLDGIRTTPIDAYDRRFDSKPGGVPSARRNSWMEESPPTGHVSYIDKSRREHGTVRDQDYRLENQRAARHPPDPMSADYVVPVRSGQYHTIAETRMDPPDFELPNTVNEPRAHNGAADDHFRHRRDTARPKMVRTVNV